MYGLSNGEECVSLAPALVEIERRIGFREGEALDSPFFSFLTLHHFISFGFLVCQREQVWGLEMEREREREREPYIKRMGFCVEMGQRK